MDRSKPQAYLSSYAPRLRTYANALLVPSIASSAPSAPLSRTTKRGTTIINYAEDGYDEYDDDDDDDLPAGRRRTTGLRGVRRDESSSGAGAVAAAPAGKETNGPVWIQGIWRDWMVHRRMTRDDRALSVQTELPLTLIPIRLDVEIPGFIPAPAIPIAANGALFDSHNAAFRPGDMTASYRLRDLFLWNLHESLITTDQFAAHLVADLDLPNPSVLVPEISKQIRTQLEEYAGIAQHPLFHTQTLQGNAKSTNKVISRSNPGKSLARYNPASKPYEPVATASANLITTDDTNTSAGVAALDPDDTYRCIVSLSFNLGSTLYTDKFEWSLLHPAGTAELFAKQTCADMGLGGEWVPAITHAIYEAVLRLKKDACEAGGLIAGWGAADISGDAVQGAEAGWRHDPEGFTDEWEPRFEILTKEEIEKREGDRERRIRRLRRETARFS